LEYRAPDRHIHQKVKSPPATKRKITSGNKTSGSPILTTMAQFPFRPSLQQTYTTTLTTSLLWLLLTRGTTGTRPSWLSSFDNHGNDLTTTMSTTVLSVPAVAAKTNDERMTYSTYDVPLPLDLQPEDLFITYRNDISNHGDDEFEGSSSKSTITPSQQQQQQQQTQHDPTQQQRRSTSNRRGLEIGDFQRFNDLFVNAQLRLPSAELSENGLTLNIENLICTGITVGDIQANYTMFPENNQDVLAYTLNAFPISITCSADYTFQVLFVKGKGRFTAVADNTRAETRLDLMSDAGSFTNGPPTTASVEYCNAAINTNGNISFDGATLERLLTLFKQLISNLVDKYAAEALCNLLNDAGPEFFNNFLNQTKVRLDNWLVVVPGNEEMSNPVFTEKSYVVPEGVTLIEFQNPNNTTNSSSSSISEVFVQFLKQADTLFGKAVIDPSSGTSDLGINTFLRKTILDAETGAWIVDLSKLTAFNPVVFQSNDKLTQSSVIVNGAKIVGIDTLQTFSPFVDIGTYTVTNALTWESLAIEITLTVDMKPSTRSDSILYNPNPVNIVENITIRIDLTNINVDMAIFMAIDQTKFESISLGSLLSTNNILPCFLSAMTALEISGLNVTIADISVPTLEGFVSPGIDRIVSQLAEAAFMAYKPTLIRAMPGLFQGPIRTMLKSRLMDSLLEVGDESKCPLISVESTTSGKPATLDFRDLFLLPTDAIASGASGNEPYGNVGHIAYDLIQDRFNEAGANGLPKINEILIDRFTKSQSGEPGLIRFPSQFVDFGNNNSNTNLGRVLIENPLFNVTNGLRFSLGDIRISNINSISFPMEFLNVTDSASILRNKISMGVNSPVVATVRVAAGFEGIINEIDISISIGALSLALDVIALVDANEFLQFPLGDILNYNCWLSALPLIELNDNGFALDTSARALSLAEFTSSISSLLVSAQCISCISSGTGLLPELLQILEDADIFGSSRCRCSEVLSQQP
jgi:hypothetical protein